MYWYHFCIFLLNILQGLHFFLCAFGLVENSSPPAYVAIKGLVCPLWLIKVKMLLGIAWSFKVLISMPIFSSAPVVWHP